MIEGGSRINARTHLNRTPLIFASYQTGNPDVIKVLLEHGADPNRFDKLGRRALNHAKQNPNLAGTSIIEILRNQTVSLKKKGESD